VHPIYRDRKEGVEMMRRVRIERKHRKGRDDRAPVLPLDPRDPDILRAKRSFSAGTKDIKAG
jgi:hypothetical protein